MAFFFFFFFFFFIVGVSLTHPVLSFGEFLLHIPCWLYVTVGGFSYTSYAGFFFSFSFFNLRSFSYRSGADFLFSLGKFS